MREKEKNMKKLIAFLALVMAVTMCLAACGDDKDDQTQNGTSTKVTTTTVTTTEGSGDATTEGDDNNNQPPAADGITIDGALSDWANIKTISIVGSGDYEGKKATFYAKLTSNGLYLACDAYHDVYTTTAGEWWQNSNFEIFVGSTANKQYWASAKGMSADNDACAIADGVTSAKMVTEELGEDQPTIYHTITEVYIAADSLPEDAVFNNTTRVGVAWKTEQDDCNNGGNNTEKDNWWAPAGIKTNDHPDANQAVVTSDGIYTKEAYTAATAGNMFFGINSEWSYVTATSATAPADPEGWPNSLPASASKGNAPFGQRAWGSTNLWATTDNPNDGTQENAYIWLAKEITIDDLSSLENKALYTNMFYDDTLSLYINGTLVFEDKDDSAWNDGYETYCITENAASLLKEGTNVIAVSLQQHTGGYEFDMNLYTFDANNIITNGKTAIYAPAAE